MATANRRRSRSRPANRQRGCSPPPTASLLFFPPELIPEVAKRLTSLQDFFALRAACRAYRAVLPLTASNLASQSPHLVSVDSTRSHALFLHPTLKRIHRFHLPRSALECNGYAITRFHPLGCRLAINERHEGAGAICSNLSIVHLLTGERACLSRPRERLSCVLLYNDLVLTWNSDGRTIQYCHREDADWRVAKITLPYFLQDLIYVNGTLYALVFTTSGYRLAAVELSVNNNSVELVFLGGHWDTSTVRVRGMHLAKCCGELILVCNVAFRVYHVSMWKFEEAKWVTITSLGGCTLFLAADDHFAGCLGPNHRGIRGDVIYTASHIAGRWYEFSLDDESSKIADAMYPGPGGENRLATWVFPKHVLK